MKKSLKSLLAGLAVAAVMAPSAYALDVTDGLNTLAGRAWGLDENLIGSGYTAPDGTVGTAAGTIGMTESLFTTARAGATLGGVNVPQPMLLDPVLDNRAGLINPLRGDERWGARTGALIGWESLQNQNGITSLISGDANNPFAVTGVAYGLTPKVVNAVGAGLDGGGNLVFAAPLDDGLAPGSVAADGSPDTIPFLLDLQGRRFATLQLSFFDENDTALFGGAVPTALIPRVNLYEGGALASFGPIPPGDALVEGDFDHNTGAQSGTTAAFADGTLLLTGRMVSAFASLTWQETAAGSGLFNLTAEFDSDVIYDGGSLFNPELDQFQFSQTVSANWNNIPFPVGTDGLDWNGLDVFDFRGGAAGIGGSFSADQSFASGGVIPEPITAGLGLISLLGLGAYATGRRNRA